MTTQGLLQTDTRAIKLHKNSPKIAISKSLSADLCWEHASERLLHRVMWVSGFCGARRAAEPPWTASGNPNLALGSKMSCTVELGLQRVNEDGELKDGDGGCSVMEKFCYTNGLLFAHP